MITQDLNIEKYPAIARALQKGETVEVHREDAEIIAKWFRKHGIICKIHNEFKSNPFRKIEILCEI